MNTQYDSDFFISPIFRQRLSDLISESNYKRAELPKKIGVSKDIIIRSLNMGILPSTKSLIKIADFFSVSIEYLLGLTDSEIFVKLEPPTTFQIRIIELKEQNSVSYFEIASSLGFSRSLFTSWKKFDYIPSLEILYIISRYFNVSIDYLLGRTDDRN